MMSANNVLQVVSGIDEKSRLLVKHSLPAWFKIRPPGKKYVEIKSLLRSLNLVTVCEEARCPNISECWSGGTVTVMVMGDTCTRACKFCHVKTGFPAKPLDPHEPQRIGSAIAQLGLSYVVITSVDRDDLKDQGAYHIAACIKEVRQQCPTIKIEVLIPDFCGNRELLQIIIDAKPDVIAHNLETVQSLQRKVRDPRAGYEQSLEVLHFVKQKDASIITKSSLMLGLGESRSEVLVACVDLRAVGVEVVTFGQYLQPSPRHIPVVEFVSPQDFDVLKQEALSCGFRYVAAGPLVRSSYRAAELFLEDMHHV
ncbi:MAG: lipoyl synthase [Nanoarchaeota archaeon]